uniref:Uncharacterized protein n=1 Tax=Grammatophora oceanica TaxID=210454 RepID=A0A7S1VX97_9STRA
MPQPPRTANEELSFRKGLDGMTILYMHPQTNVFQVTKLPSNEPISGHNRMPYLERGWIFAENCWSAVVKDLGGAVFDLGKLKDNEDDDIPIGSMSDLQQLCRKNNTPHFPLLPDFFKLANENQHLFQSKARS